MSSSEIINKQHTSQSLSEDLQSSPWINLLIHDPDSSVGLTSNCGLTSLSSWWSSSPCLQARSAQPNFSCHEQHPVREQRNDQYHVDHKYAQVFRNKEKTSSCRTHPCNRCNTSLISCQCHLMMFMTNWFEMKPRRLIRGHGRVTTSESEQPSEYGSLPPPV